MITSGTNQGHSAEQLEKTRFLGMPWDAWLLIRERRRRTSTVQPAFFLAAGAAGCQRIEKAGKYPYFCHKYPLVNIQKAMENGHL